MQHALVAAVTGVVVVVAEPTSVSLNIDGVKSIFTFCPCPGFHTLTFLHSYTVYSILGMCLWDKNENCAHTVEYLSSRAYGYRCGGCQVLPMPIHRNPFYQ